MIQFPGAKASWCPACDALAFHGCHRWFDSGHDGFGDLVLHREHTVHHSVMAVSPDMGAGFRLDQLRRDA